MGVEEVNSLGQLLVKVSKMSKAKNRRYCITANSIYLKEGEEKEELVSLEKVEGFRLVIYCLILYVKEEDKQYTLCIYPNKVDKVSKKVS